MSPPHPSQSRSKVTQPGDGSSPNVVFSPTPGDISWPKGRSAGFVPDSSPSPHGQLPVKTGTPPSYHGQKPGLQSNDASPVHSHTHPTPKLADHRMVGLMGTAGAAALDHTSPTKFAQLTSRDQGPPFGVQVDDRHINSSANGDIRMNGSLTKADSNTTYDAPTSAPTFLPDAGAWATHKKAEVRSARKEAGHQHSHSRHHHQQDLKTVGEYAIHHLFNSFVAQAEQKINQCLKDIDGSEPRVESICGPGVDPGFDQLITALGHIARQKPKPLIDTLMFWRKSKSEAANQAKAELSSQTRAMSPPPTGPFVRRNTDGGQPPGDAALVFSPQPEASLSARQLTVSRSERSSTVSVYLLFRALIEVVGQTNLARLEPEMARRLLDTIYPQFRAFDPYSLVDSPLRQANWNIYSQFLGAMSDINFEGVTHRFISDLEQMERSLGAKSANLKDLESRAALIVTGMRHVRIKINPDEMWRRSCQFMQSVAFLFANIHVVTVKYAYCQTIEELLVPVASEATIQVTTPEWREVVNLLRSRLMSMLAKPKHWQEVFPITTMLLCASPLEVFATHWHQLLTPMAAKLKDRNTRSVMLKGVARLMWTYLYRVSDNQTAVAKKLDEVVKVIFQHGKKPHMSTEAAIAEPLIQLIRIIGYRYQDYCFRNIIFPLMNSEAFVSRKDFKVDSLEPERMVVGIRAFLAVMADLERGEEPLFPHQFDTEITGEFTSSINIPHSARQAGSTSTKFTTVKEERLSRPVMIATFTETLKEHYTNFCKVLGEVTIICDNAFGGQAVLDEKFASSTPKTPMSDAFGGFIRKDDIQTPTETRQGFYDLLHVAVQALPRCLSSHIPLNPLVNLLCTGTAHVHSSIAGSSAQSLKSIAKQGFAQHVTIGFARFIFNFDDRYSTMSDGGLLGAEHIENTLSLYVELLQIWIDEIKQKPRKTSLDSSGGSPADSRAIQLDRSGIWAYVDEIESHGLFFLCSPSHRVRVYAVTVLRLVTDFDVALGKVSSRLIQIVDGSVDKIINLNDEKLTVTERSRLQRCLNKNEKQGTLIQLCCSEIPYDNALWFKIFANLVMVSFDHCPFAFALTKEIVCTRIAQMQRVVGSMADLSRVTSASALDLTSLKNSNRLAATSPDMIIEQWKLYLIFACATLTNLGTGKPVDNVPVQHNRKMSRSSQRENIKALTATELFMRVIPLLSVENGAIRNAVVVGLGSINQNLHRTLLECLQSAVVSCNEEARGRLGNHQRTTSSPRRSHRTDHLRTEIAQVYRLTSHFLQKSEVPMDEWILNNIVNYAKELRIFLNDAEVQDEWGFQKLRTHYCGLMEELYEGINKYNDPMRWMPFQARKAAFALMEDWCGYSPNQGQIKQREDNMRKSVLGGEPDLSNRGIVTAAMEIEKRDLRTAALSAMASLCGGPLSITTDSKVVLYFNVARLLSWIDAIFATPSDKIHAIGRRALRNLIIHNKDHPYLLARSIELCYTASSTKALSSYFDVVSSVITDPGDYPFPFFKVLGAGLYILGNENNKIRTKAAKFLRMLEERSQRTFKLNDLDISISDKTKTVYRLAQFEMSRRMAYHHSDIAIYVFSEFTSYFKLLQSDHQRGMVAAMLPWLQTIELQLDPNGGISAASYMVLLNLFEITVRNGAALHNEISALWQALVTGPYPNNVQLTLDFIISLCLDRREQSFVEYAKQIVVHLSSTLAGSKVVELLLVQITPKAMVLEKRDSPTVPTDKGQFPYVADITVILPVGNKQSGFSLGQLSIILLVDLMVSPMQVAKEALPLLIQMVVILWDHYTPLVQDQARELLVHLLHELVISKLDDTAGTQKSVAEDLAEMIRHQDLKVSWAYDDNNSTDGDDMDISVPSPMVLIITEAVSIFSAVFPTIRDDWGKLSLVWATSCPVRHLACRSFQIFRCLQISLDQQMLAGILARLSNTIADDETDILSFSLEILITLRTMVTELQSVDVLRFPQFFWTTCACLNTIHEPEFRESLKILDKLLDKVDLGNTDVVSLLREASPQNWEGDFEGVQSLVFKGMRSGDSHDLSLRLLERLVQLPSNELVGDQSRYALTILANLPRLLHNFPKLAYEPQVSSASEALAKVCAEQGWDKLSAALDQYSRRTYRSEKDFLAQITSGIKEYFFPDLEFAILTFMMGSMTNELAWFKIKMLQVLSAIIPDIDMRKQEISSQGPEVISPLLRLLQTEFCPNALEVLDNVMTVTGAPMDKHHLRMSMAGSHSTKAFRKEYAKTQCLYGIPEESGWAIPMPAVYSAYTRSNVHSVFYTCSAALQANLAAAVATADGVDFKTEEEAYGGYPADYRTATMLSDDGRDIGNMGDLVMKLDSLDDFFEDDLTEANNTTASRTLGGGLSSSAEAVRETVYEEQTLPILHKSLHRNASLTSFQTGLADHTTTTSTSTTTATTTTNTTTHTNTSNTSISSASTPTSVTHNNNTTNSSSSGIGNGGKATSIRDPAIMTPAAFASQPPSSRSGVHSRSVTSGASFSNRSLQSSPSTEEQHDALSDEEAYANIRSPAQERQFSLENIIRPIASNTRSGLRSGLRRLTSGHNDGRDRERTTESTTRLPMQSQRSPKVPKIPEL